MSERAIIIIEAHCSYEATISKYIIWQNTGLQILKVFCLIFHCQENEPVFTFTTDL